MCNSKSIPELVNVAFEDVSSSSERRILIASIIRRLLLKYQDLQVYDERYRREGLGSALGLDTKKLSMRLILRWVEEFIRTHNESTIHVLDALISGCGFDDGMNMEKLKHEELCRRLKGLDEESIDRAGSTFVKSHCHDSCAKQSHICNTWKAELQKDMKDISNPFILQMKVFSQNNATG